MYGEVQSNNLESEIDESKIRNNTKETDSVNQSPVLPTYLLADNVRSGFDVRRYGRCPGAIGLVHHPDSAPYSISVLCILRKLKKFEFVNVHVRNVALVWGHPRRDWSLMAVEPLRPVECDCAPSTYFRNSTWDRLVDSVASNITAGRIKNRKDIATTKGNAIGRRGDLTINHDIPARVALKRNISA
jgi:hypothetical protein